jgi:aminoglycoside 6'-N-acetyltransferase
MAPLIRPYVEADLPALAAIVAQPEVVRWWGRYDEERLRKEIASATFTWTVEVAGRPAGLINATDEPDPEYRHFEFDVFLDAALHGQGIGSDALRQAARVMFDERGHHRGCIYTSPENARALHVYEKLGFRPVGLLRKAVRDGDGPWEDELMLDLLAEELR